MIIVFSPITTFFLCFKHIPFLAIIHIVSRSVFIFPIIFLSICYFVSVCRALGQTHSFACFGLCIGLCGLQMCAHTKYYKHSIDSKKLYFSLLISLSNFDLSLNNSLFVSKRSSRFIL